MCLGRRLCQEEGSSPREKAGSRAQAGAALSAVLGAETECVSEEEKGAESKGQLGRCFHSRRTQTPPAGVTGQETVSCVLQVVRTAFYSRPAAALGQAGLKRRGRRQKELGWLPLGTEKVSSHQSGDTVPRHSAPGGRALRFQVLTSWKERPSCLAPRLQVRDSSRVSPSPRPAWGDLSMAQR